MEIFDGGITAPLGFNSAGKHIGIKKFKKDLSVVTSDVSAIPAGCFTKSVVKASHIIWDDSIVKSGKKVRGIITVSGNANACTGKKGMEDNEEMAETIGSLIGAEKEEILTAATGIIGLKMPMDTIKKGISEIYNDISNSRQSAIDAAWGIITTDTFIKEMAVRINISGKVVTIGAMAKGSGMIHPDMATVLVFISTDINISKELLQKALSASVKKTYNMISVDGATSTNDMALILANGLAGNEEIVEENDEYYEFAKALLYINEKFAKDIVHDGEGSSKLFEVRVDGAKTENDAKVLAKSIITNNLVKTAMYGEDPNWGRVLAAMGGSGAFFNPDEVYIAFESAKGYIELMKNSEPLAFDENTAIEILSEQDIVVHILLTDGNGKARAWGCDLGHEYVRINGEYRSRT